MSRLPEPILPLNPDSAYARQLDRKLLDFFRTLVTKVNGMASSTFAHCADNASVAMPTSGTYAKDDFVPKSGRVQAGAVGSKYVITGWIRLTDGSAHVAGVDWVEARVLTGN